MIRTDYTETGSLAGEAIGKYRFSHWLLDVIKNFMSDPINIRDERLCRLLAIQDDGMSQDLARSLFRVDVPYTTDTRKACTTPAIMVSAGATEYPLFSVNHGWQSVTSLIGSRSIREMSVNRTISGMITVITESCDGTQLLAGLIEDFLVMNAIPLQHDGMVQQLTVTGSSEPKRIGVGEAGNAKDVYQVVIMVTACGGITWTQDTQGPVFRGVSLNPVVAAVHD